MLCRKSRTISRSSKSMAKEIPRYREKTPPKELNKFDVWK
jgi:hypothetical protein